MPNSGWPSDLPSDWPRDWTPEADLYRFAFLCWGFLSGINGALARLPDSTELDAKTRVELLRIRDLARKFLDHWRISGLRPD